MPVGAPVQGGGCRVERHHHLHLRHLRQPGGRDRAQRGQRPDEHLQPPRQPELVVAARVGDDELHLCRQRAGDLVHDASGTTTYKLDKVGLTLSPTGPMGRTTSYTYDADGRQASVTGPTGATTRSANDPAGRLVSQTVAMGGLRRAASAHELRNSGQAVIARAGRIAGPA